MHAVATPRSKSVMRMESLGYGKFDAATNMAVDEAMASQSAETGKSFIRFYDFERRSIILCEYDSVNCLKLDNLAGIDITRRKTSGRPIYVSSNILSYALSFPYFCISKWGDSLRDIHQRFGRLTADAIAKVAGIDPSELTLPRTSSIRFKNEPIAGHAQYVIPKKSILYHGIIAIAPWDIDEIDSIWHLGSDDLARIAKLPSVMGIASQQTGNVTEVKSNLVTEVTAALSDNLYGKSTEEISEILERAKKLKSETYANKEWIFRTDRNRIHEKPFCILWEENGSGISPQIQ